MAGVSGAVFDIRRFSIHDGKGIRTTVFLKGCPLRCRWCQNPEGIDPRRRLVWLSGPCVHCKRCTETAAALGLDNVLRWEDGVLRISQEGADDAAWDTVLDACPAAALIRDSRIMSADEVLAELEKDRVFFNHSGGFTLSGGEPLAQASFALALLEKGKEAGIHSAFESSLFAAPETVDAAADLAGQVFADCKIFNEDRHIEAAGQGNSLILENLKRLLTGKNASKVTVRIPLIPGCTAGRENIASIADFIYACNPGAACELINYNPLAAAKYPCGELRWPFTEDYPPYSAEEMEAFRTIVRERGVGRPE